MITRMLFGVLILGLLGCTIRYSAKVGPQRKALKQLSAQSAQLTRAVDTARKERQRMLSQCKNQGAPMTTAPYPNLRKSLQAANTVRRQMQVKHRKMKKLRKRFDRISKGKKRLYSDGPGWEQNQSIRDEAETLHQAMGKLSNDAQGIFRTFDSDARKAKFGLFDRAKLVGQARKQIKGLRSQMRKTVPNIRSAEARLNSAVMLKAKAKTACQSALSTMAQAQKAISKLIESLESDLRSIQKITPAKSQISLCPGLVAHSTLPKIQADSKAIGTHIQSINAASARCRSATR
jgi:DNA repair exonuclease SbcCD ATPase subunit